MAEDQGATHPRRAVLGLGGTVDYEVVWEAAVLERLVQGYRILPTELDHAGPIASERDLVVSILSFLRAGAGGERFVASSDIIEQFASRLDTRVTLGGTCVRAAIAMSAVGVPSTVHLVSMNDATRRLLPGDVDWICSAEEDTTDPHLIVQYPRGGRVRSGDVDVVAPHPNRLIYANDPPHRELVLSDQLGATLADAGIFLVSSLNVIQERAVLDARLASLQRSMRHLPGDALVVFEDAGYHMAAFSRVVRDALAPIVDVYGCNEDELQAHLDRTVDLLDPDDVAAAVEEFAAIVQVPALVVHTRHWALAHGPEAGRYALALAGGTTMAATRYRCGDGFGARDYHRTASLPVQPAGAALARGLHNLLGSAVVCVPAHDIATADPTTIGLGDTFVGGFVAALTAPSSTNAE